MEFKLLLFDLDNTLFDFDKSQEQALQYTLDQIDHPFDLSTLQQFRSINSRLWTEHELGNVTKEYIYNKRFSELLRSRASESINLKTINKLFLNKLASSYIPIEGAEMICKNLSSHYATAIITNGDSSTQRKRLKDSGFDQYFDFIVISDEVGFAKPDKRIFQAAIDLHSRNTRAEQALIIGDSFTADIMGGKSFGMKTCWYNPNKHPCPALNWRPDFTVSRLAQLSEIVPILN